MAAAAGAYQLSPTHFDTIASILRIRGDLYLCGVAPARAHGGHRCMASGGRVRAEAAAALELTGESEDENEAVDPTPTRVSSK